MKYTDIKLHAGNQLKRYTIILAHLGVYCVSDASVVPKEKINILNVLIAVTDL